MTKFCIFEHVEHLYDSKTLADAIYSWLLPPIVLAEGFFSRKEVFKKAECLKSTAVLGTLVSTVFTIFSQKALACFCELFDFNDDLSVDWTFIIILTVGLNTADYHGALAPFHAMPNRKMERLIGTGVIVNNQIALIFSQTLDRSQDSGDYSTKTVVVNLFKCGILSIIFGLMMGVLCTLTQKKWKWLNKNACTENIYIICWAYFTYALAHFGILQLSGDMAIFFFAMVISYFNKYNMSLTGAGDIQVTLSAIFVIAEVLVYFFQAYYQPHLQNASWNLIIYGCLVFLTLIFARFLTHCFLHVMNKIYFKDPALTWNVGFLAHFSTLIKGPISFIFACMLGFDYKAEIIPIYQICIMGSIVIQPPIHYILSKRQMPQDTISDKLRKKIILEHQARKSCRINPHNPHFSFLTEEYYIKPKLIRDYIIRYKEMKQIHKIFKEVGEYLEHGEHVEGHDDAHGDHHDDHKHESNNHDHDKNIPSNQVSLIETKKKIGIFKSFSRLFTGSFDVQRLNSIDYDDDGEYTPQNMVQMNHQSPSNSLKKKPVQQRRMKDGQLYSNRGLVKPNIIHIDEGSNNDSLNTSPQKLTSGSNNQLSLTSGSSNHLSLNNAQQQNNTTDNINSAKLGLQHMFGPGSRLLSSLSQNQELVSVHEEEEEDDNNELDADVRNRRQSNASKQTKGFSAMVNQTKGVSTDSNNYDILATNSKRRGTIHTIGTPKYEDDDIYQGVEEKDSDFGESPPDSNDSDFENEKHYKYVEKLIETEKSDYKKALTQKLKNEGNELYDSFFDEDYESKKVLKNQKTYNLADSEMAIMRHDLSVEQTTLNKSCDIPLHATDLEPDLDNEQDAFTPHHHYHLESINDEIHEDNMKNARIYDKQDSQFTNPNTHGQETHKDTVKPEFTFSKLNSEVEETTTNETTKANVDIDKDVKVEDPQKEDEQKPNEDMNIGLSLKPSEDLENSKDGKSD